MTDTSSIFVVLIDADDIKHVFSTWPDHICLAACLTRDGDCSMVVFRRDERPVVPQRLLEMLDVEAQDVCIVPKVRGFETRHFLYSDERRLMALVASDPDLLDEAIDYSMNYTYALEEGLEPSVVLGLSKPAPAREPRQPATPVSAMRPQPTPQSEPAPQSQMPQAALSPLLPEFLRKSAEGSHRPKFASVRRSTEGMLAAVH
ncbi:flagellar motor protein [Sulfitobacter sp. M57]|uniref:flagellar motor protein n=1 Tax=unclassified Sulfitobacter TaxID=196795 RepID=UPI0023E15790|nr:MULTISPECIES: flagellar motor protein [unclassified Sulfitobacter]MDF3414845.1 flagellar motor protein [Sulfitobacter sp. KE5]MDF3422326.1 flagellar motor protein [Sulfitobacter sp. KE43]MDF3433391.1 flagellar motor protein [Sulfitobacter sp. KE42]MDF3459031.1 flagellar motor protein [Sulfitobacter sp. S74]MDF3462930.1 flagellar motor protein [Sulfitobacter sp. Ks18]